MSGDDVSKGFSIKHIVLALIALLVTLSFFVFEDIFENSAENIAFPVKKAVLYENESIPVYISGLEEETYFVSFFKSGEKEPVSEFESKISVLDAHTYAANLGVLEPGKYRLDLKSSASEGKILDSRRFEISRIPEAEVSLVSMKAEDGQVVAELSVEASSPEGFDIHSVEWALENAESEGNSGAVFHAVLPARAGDLAGLVFITDEFGGRMAVDFTLQVPPVNALLGGAPGLLFQQGQPTPSGGPVPVQAPLPCDCTNMAVNMPNPIAPAAGAALPQSSVYCFGPVNVVPSMCSPVPPPPGPAGPGIPPAVAPGCPAGLIAHTCTIGWGGLLAAGPQADQLSHGFEIVATLANAGTQKLCKHGQLAQMDHSIAFVGGNVVPLPNVIPGKAAPANPLTIPAGVTKPAGNPFPARAINFSPIVPSRRAQPIPRVTWAGDNYTSTANLLVEYRNNIIRWYDAPTSAPMSTGKALQLDKYDTDDAFLSYVLGSGNGGSCWCQHRHFYSWDRTKNPQLQGIFMVKTSGLRCP